MAEAEQTLPAHYPSHIDLIGKMNSSVSNTPQTDLSRYFS